MMTRKTNQRSGPSASGKPSSNTKRNADRVSRQCRGYHARTLSYVRTSLDRWSFIFDLPRVDFSPEFQDCSQLARLVKKLLGSCPSDDPAIVMAYQSIKKGLPDSCECMSGPMLTALEENVVNGTPPVLPRGYLAFVKKTVSSLFPKGWDTDYEGFCRRAAPPLTASLATPRSNGGVLTELSGYLDTCLGEVRLSGQSEFLDVALFGKNTVTLGHPEAALQVVQSAGKPRPLTSFSAKSFYLKPLHKTIYKRLSKMKWLCRGDVTEDKLKAAGFSRKLGGVLTSGDYASATDNLSIEVYETCLSVMLENAVTVPPNIIDYALRACRPTLYESVNDYRMNGVVNAILGEWHPMCPLPPIKKGQMMGSLLSFPLLCLQNYLAFRWSTRSFKGKIPVIINGDDILFQSPKDVSDAWMRTVGQIGLQVEPTKTSVERDWGTLNSTLFSFRGEELALVPTLRFGMLRPSEYPHSLGAGFHDFVRGQEGRRRWKAGQVYFEAHLGALRQLDFSLPSVGFRGTLALRLAKKYGLLDGDRLTGELPPTPEKHSVCLPHDLVSEVPNEYVDPEVADLNATETAAWKWSMGYSGTSRERSAIRYCLSMTRFTNDTSTISDIVVAMSCDDSEFAYRFGERARLTVRGASRKCLSEPFFRDRESRTTVRLFWRIAEEILRRAEWFWGQLPSYEEATAEGAGQWCCRRAEDSFAK
jgi:hypothetical protein